MVNELIAQDRYRIEHLYALPDWCEKHGVEFIDHSNTSGAAQSSGDFKVASDLNKSDAIPGSRVSEKELSRISQLTTPNQVLAVVTLPDHSNATLPDLSAGWSLYLDGIQSPANLGAILRVADWFGFHHVFGGPGTADLYNPKSIQATMGTFLRVDYREMGLPDILAKNKDLPIFAADLEGENAFTFSPPRAGMLVIGNEGRGIRPATRELVTNYLRIPRAPGRKAESLNAAVAAGILCGVLAG